jgi:hypothetical protein
MITGLASSLPQHLIHGLTANGVPHDAAARVAALPPVGVLFASLLGYNPIQSLLGPQVLHHLPAATQAHLTGHAFFPSLISPSFSDGLGVAFGFAIAACVIAALASAMRGGKYVHTEPELADGAAGARDESYVMVAAGPHEGHVPGAGRDDDEARTG